MKSCCQYMVCSYETDWVNIILAVKLIGHITYYQVAQERSGSVVECLNRDRRAAGSSLAGVTALCP